MKVASAAVARGKVWTCGTSCSGLKGQGVVVNSTPSFDQRHRAGTLLQRQCTREF